MIDPQEHQRQNEITLLAMQALLGLISEDVIAVAVRFEGERVDLVFWAHRESSELEEDAEEATFELDVLFSENHPLIKYVINIGEPDPKPIGPGERMIYRAKRKGQNLSSDE